MLVHLRLENLKLIEFGLGRHAQLAVSLGTVRQTRPEIGKLVNDSGIIPDGRLQVSGPVVQECTVKDSQIVLRLHLDDIIEVGDGTVVIAQLHTQLSAVIVSHKIVGVKIQRGIIIGHRSTQIVIVVACQGPVYIVGHHFRPQVYGLAQIGICIFPLPPGETDVGTSVQVLPS